MGLEANPAFVNCEDKDDIYYKEAPALHGYLDTDPTTFSSYLEEEGT